MTARPEATDLALAQVLAHCGGDPEGAVGHLARALTMAPGHPEPYRLLADMRRDGTAGVFEGRSWVGAVAAAAYLSYLDGDHDEAVMLLGAVVGHDPRVAWADAPWFGDPAFVEAVGEEAVAEAVLRITDGGHDLTAAGMDERFVPWFRLIDAVAARGTAAEPLAKMAKLLRACGRFDASFALCDRADAVERIVFTEAVRAGTWRVLGDTERMVAAFERALALDPTNWSLYLDLADSAAIGGDHAAALDLVERGLVHEPGEVTLRAARAAFRARLTGSAADLADLRTLARDLHPQYRAWLTAQATPD